MPNTYAFSPAGITVSITAAVVVPAAVQAVSSTPSTHPVYQYRVINSGVVEVLLGVGSSAAAAAAAAASLAAGAIPLVPGAVEVLGFPSGSFFSGKTAASTAVVYITPGDGV